LFVFGSSVETAAESKACSPLRSDELATPREESTTSRTGGLGLAGYRMQRASTISVFACPPLSTRPWTAQSVFGFPANDGPELITDAPSVARLFAAERGRNRAPSRERDRGEPGARRL
jgi:hypothetical protein